MTPTLTDRYVWAVTQHLPTAQRDDIGDELRATVADMIEASEAPPEQAERAALEDLGDPRRLAANYHEGRRYLIGPDVYDDYLSVLRVVLATVVPIIAVLSGGGVLLDDGQLGEAAVAAIGGALNVGVWVAVGTTLTFALAGRGSPEERVDAADWSVDELPDLPDVPSSRISTADAVSTLAVSGLAIAALFWQRTRFPVTTSSGEHVPLLQPALWDGWMWVLIAILVASMGVVLVAFRAGRWTLPLACLNALVNAASIGVVAWLALDDRLINPEVLVVIADRSGWDQVPTVNPWLIVLVIGAIEVWDTAEAFLAARRPTSVSS